MTDALDKLAERLPEVKAWKLWSKYWRTPNTDNVVDTANEALDACATEVERLESELRQRRLLFDTVSDARVKVVMDRAEQAEAELAALKARPMSLRIELWTDEKKPVELLWHDVFDIQPGDSAELDGFTVVEVGHFDFGGPPAVVDVPFRGRLRVRPNREEP